MLSLHIENVQYRKLSPCYCYYQIAVKSKTPLCSVLKGFLCVESDEGHFCHILWTNPNHKINQGIKE